MTVFKEIKEIAKCMSKVYRLSEKLANDGFDCDGIEWPTATFVSLDKEDIAHFKGTNGVTEGYFVDQWTGYSGDDFHGELYFKTDVPGQYVRVHFNL